MLWLSIIITALAIAANIIMEDCLGRTDGYSNYIVITINDVHDANRPHLYIDVLHTVYMFVERINVIL